MTSRRVLFLALAVAVQLLAWSDAVPACVSMAHCGRTAATPSHCAPPVTISGTSDCCTSGSVGAPAPVSPMPQRAQSVTPEVTIVDTLALPAPPVAAGPSRATAERPRTLPPLLGSCILRI